MPESIQVGSTPLASPFQTVRRALAVSLAASILVPLACVIAYGGLDYGRRVADANSRLLVLSRVAQENASRVFDLNAVLTARTLDLLGNATREEIRQREPEIHRQLAAFLDGLPQVASLSVFGPGGDLIASSRYSPPPAVAITDRGGFGSSPYSSSHPYISLPLYRRIDGETVLVSSVERASNGDGHLGIISVALRRKYLVDLYSTFLDNDPAYTVSLYRREGAAMLASSSSNIPWGGLEHNRNFAQAIKENVLFGNFTQEGGGRGDDMLVSFRRVGDYPVYVASTFDLDDLRGAWWRDLIVIAITVLIPSAMSCAWILRLLVRLRPDEAEWQRRVHNTA
ncbi:hypothetical protein [Paraburkholderia hospita]|uniref:hypothetical protein n=1 Tax=Paraburkholderia hospita TaxID=169430 RepID=UPI000B34530F|nr:hypothetical protein [Paraburkholderia hospita]OUL70034.1 hypothetical protein CA603_49925 [Paraburkholderia hospita]